MTLEKLEELLKARFGQKCARVKDSRGDGKHIEVWVTSPLFQGKSLVEQHKMVYEVLGPHAGTTFHALQINTQSSVYP